MKPIILITGSGRRIGASMAKFLHQRGYAIAIHCHRSLNEAHELAATCNTLASNTAKVFSCDLQPSSNCEMLIQKVLAWKGSLHGLINNASVFYQTPFDRTTNQDWDTICDSNLKAPFFLSYSAKDALIKTKGCIINITDIHASKPLKNYGIYCIAKAGLTMLTQVLAKELAPDVRVNAIAPGAILWPENENQLTPLQQQAIIEKTALKTSGHPDYLSQTILFLLENPFITGQIIAVDGGRLLG